MVNRCQKSVFFSFQTDFIILTSSNYSIKQIIYSYILIQTIFKQSYLKHRWDPNRYYKYIWLNGISTLVGWLIPNPVYIYIFNTNCVEHNRHFLSTYFLVDPFILPYCFYCIRRELIDVFSINVYIPSTFSLTLGHHQERIYYKSDVTFVFALLLCKSVFTVGVYSVCF